MRFLCSEYANNAFAAGAPPRTPLGELTPLPQTPLGKWGGASRDGAPGRGDPQEGEEEEQKGEGRGEGKIVATRCQILRLKCEDAQYKCTD